VHGTLQIVGICFPKQGDKQMSEPRYTTTPNLSGCTIIIGDRVHGLFIAKRARPRLATAADMLARPRPQEVRPL
jgi:hypothetical protein